MKRLLLMVFLLSVSVFARAALHVKIEPSKLRLGESMMLTITEEGGNHQAATPNLLPLEKDFTILGTQRSMNYSIYNGQTQAVVEWIIQMEAKRAGSLVIPAITIGSQKTLPLPIQVEETAAVTQYQGADEPVYLKTEVDTKNSYVNQEINLTVKVYYSVRLIDPQYHPPEVEDALIRPIGETEQFQEIIDNKRYVVEQQKYAIFPQKSGPLTILSPKFKALLFDAVPRRIEAKAKPIKLDIKPAPTNTTVKPWLPAKNIQLTENYSESNTNLLQGTTLIRTITLEARGVPAELLPKISFETQDKFSVYPEQGKPESVVDANDLVGKMVVKVTYLFNKAGKIEIPELQIPWFNTTTNKDEIATLPARTFEIKETAHVTEANPTSIKPETSSIQKEAVLSPKKGNGLTYLLILFALGWIITAALWMRQYYANPKGKKLYQLRLDALRQACLQNDASSTRQALLNWATLYWPNTPIRNLMDIAQCGDDALKEEVTKLSEVLYSKKGKPIWNGDALWTSISALINKKHQKSKSKYVLPPINPK